MKFIDLIIRTNPAFDSFALARSRMHTPMTEIWKGLEVPRWTYLSRVMRIGNSSAHGTEDLYKTQCEDNDDGGLPVGAQCRGLNVNTGADCARLWLDWWTKFSHLAPITLPLSHSFPRNLPSLLQALLLLCVSYSTKFDMQATPHTSFQIIRWIVYKFKFSNLIIYSIACWKDLHEIKVL